MMMAYLGSFVTKINVYRKMYSLLPIPFFVPCRGHDSDFNLKSHIVYHAETFLFNKIKHLKIISLKHDIIMLWFLLLCLSELTDKGQCCVCV